VQLIEAQQSHGAERVGILDREVGIGRENRAKSGDGFSHQSTSPPPSAAAAVEGSDMTNHSIRSTLTTLPPDAQSGGSARGT